MPAPILATKLYIPPPRPNIVLRSRLVERLNEGLHRKLTLVSAPAGFGKTTLVSEWIAGYGRPVAWLSLDEGDNDLTRFLTYLIAALQTIELKIGAGVLNVLQSPQPPATESILTTLLNDINAIPDNFILVLDDYHVIDSEPIDLALTFLLDHLPQQMHMVITTREDPSLPLPRYRVRGQLIELRAANLRFSSAEASAFLNQMMNLNLSVENIVALEARTEGWIAGLQLAAISMQGRSDTASFIQAFTGSHRFVLDYLAGEVLERQPERVRTFLLQTAILDRLSVPVCNAVTEREDGKEMLDILEHSNLFLIPLDDQRQWYRYHHLFADVLQAHLMEAQPDRAASLHLRASKWYEQNGLPADAIRHALAAKDFEYAAGLIELAWPAELEESFSFATWLGWVKKLPDELVHMRPVLNVGYAFALLGMGEIEAADTRLKDAERWLEPSDPIEGKPDPQSLETQPDHHPRMVIVNKKQFRSLPETIAVGRAYIAQSFGNIQETVRYASQVLELVPEADPFRRGQASMLLGITYWAVGDLEAAERIFADYTMKLRKGGNIQDAISTSVVLADIRKALGHLQEAIYTIEQLLQFILDQGEPISPDMADLHRELSDLYLEQWDLEVAAQHLQISMEIGEKAEMPVWRYRWYFSQACFKRALDDEDGALERLDQAEKLYIRTPLPDLYPISAMKARIWVAQGKLTKAMEWVNGQELSADDDLSFLREFDHITLARILIAQYENEHCEDTIHTAMRLLTRLLQAAEEGKRIGSVIEILVLQALAHYIQGSPTSALEPLKRALNLAMPEGFVRIFVDTGKPLAELLRTKLLLIICRINPRLGPSGEKSGWHDKLRSIPKFLPILVLFIMVIGGIYAGIFSAMEGGGIGAFGALVIAAVSRSFSWHKFNSSIMESAKTNSMLLFVIIAGLIFGNGLGASGLSSKLVETTQGLGLSPFMFVGLILIIYLIFGIICDAPIILLLTLPILAPIVRGMGVDMIWFGVMSTLIANLGAITPPFAMGIFMLKNIGPPDLTISSMYRGVIPYCIASLVVALIIMFYPSLATWLPDLMMK